MSDRKFTLLEIHLDGDTQFGPKVIGEGTVAEGTGVSDPDERDGESGDRENHAPTGKVGGALKALAVLGLLVVGAKTAADIAGKFTDEATREVEIEADDGLDEAESATD